MPAAPPLHHCPGCCEWTPRTAWAGDGAAGAIDFTTRCPSCGRWVDIAEIDYKLGIVSITIAVLDLADALS